MQRRPAQPEPCGRGQQRQHEHTGHDGRAEFLHHGIRVGAAQHVGPEREPHVVRHHASLRQQPLPGGHALDGGVADGVVDGTHGDANSQHEPRRGHGEQEALLRAQRGPVRQQERPLEEQHQHRSGHEVFLAGHAERHRCDGKRLPPSRRRGAVCPQRRIQRTEQAHGREQRRLLGRVGNRVGAQRVHHPDEREGQGKGRCPAGIDARGEVGRPHRPAGQQEQQHAVEQVQHEVAEVRTRRALAEQREAHSEAEAGERAVRERLVRRRERGVPPVAGHQRHVEFDRRTVVELEAEGRHLPPRNKACACDQQERQHGRQQEAGCRRGLRDRCDGCTGHGGRIRHRRPGRNRAATIRSGWSARAA